VFKISLGGMFTSMASFNRTNGAFPYAGLVEGTYGSFFGTAWQGGAHGFGAIFALGPSGLLTNLYSFNGKDDGANPAGGLLEGSDGNFYGSAVFGGAYGQGTVFRISPNGVFTRLAAFNGQNGANPQTALVESPDGAFYGTTQNGSRGGGTLYRLSVTSTPQIIAQPMSQAVYEGAEVVFSVSVVGSPPLSYQWRKNGSPLSDASNVSGVGSRVLRLSGATPADRGAYSVVVSNALDSATSAEALLEVSTSLPIVLLQPTNQTCAPGATIAVAVTAVGNLPLSYFWRKNDKDLTDAGNLFGSQTSTLTLTNVTEADNGVYTVLVSNVLGTVTSDPAVLTVIPVSAPGTRFATVAWFSGASEGGNPNQLFVATDGNLYGTTKYGGQYKLGAAFRLNPGGLLTPLLSFHAADGSIPRAGLIQGRDGNFYGTTAFGGVADAGTVFRFTAEGELEILHSFSGLDGANPEAALVEAGDGSFYGSTRNGGDNGWGTLFRLMPKGDFTLLYSFNNGPDGSSPGGALVQAADGNFYGLTQNGGASGKGSVFRLAPAGIFTTVYSFTGGSDGYSPVGALIEATDGKLYGATKHNVFLGYEFYGTFFKASLAGSLTTLYSLNGFTGDGFYPSAGLIEGADGNFYGTTHDGGVYGKGTVFRLSPTGAHATLVSFDGAAFGGNPDSALVQTGDGSLYGTTTTGGPGGAGTAYRLTFTSTPQITTPPAGMTVAAGAEAKLSVAAFGAPPLYFQWRKDGTDLADSGNVSGATARVLTFTNISLADAGSYSVRVSNALDAVTSTDAVLKVVTAPAFQVASKNKDTLILTWTAIPGERYRLQYTSNPDFGAWLNLGSIRTATSNSISASDAIVTNLQRFYRVWLLP
jgi:uncharacterized repeat protein (TIGR03803 family)